MVEPILKFVVLLSGNGSNLQAVMDSQTYLPLRVTNVISNKSDAYGLVRAQNAGISTHVLERIEGEKRVEYDRRLYELLSGTDYDYILLLGWMRLLSGWFISQVGSDKLINLHPALPGQFPGANSIEDAYKSGVSNTGVMVHHVVEEMDAGKVLGQTEVPVYPLDTLEMLKTRVQYFEKFVLMKVISELVDHRYKSGIYRRISGKVRDIYEIGYDMLAILTTDRQSAFDRYICDIEGKGVILSCCSAWWFNQTRHIIPNHMVYNDSNVMIVKKCNPIKVEVVVRGYITGNTKTSLWAHYSLGERVYCGHSLPDGLVMNQKLETPIVTPTSKGVVDTPMSGEEIVNSGILSLDDWEYILGKALELFEYGTKVAASKGLILVDTKYEFGRDINDDIILIDEIHTCDSSRYWDLESYDELFKSGERQKSYDKDVLRNYLRDFPELYSLDDSNSCIEVPDSLVLSVKDVYYKFFDKLVENVKEPNTYLKPDQVIADYFENHYKYLVMIISRRGCSGGDVDRLRQILRSGGVFTIKCELSEWSELNEIMEKYKERRCQYVLVMDESIEISCLDELEGKSPGETILKLRPERVSDVEYIDTIVRIHYGLIHW